MMMSPSAKPGWKPSPRPRDVSATDEPGVGEPVEPPRSRIRPRLREKPGGFPRALAIAAVAWLAVAFLALWAGFDALGSDPGQRNAQDINNQLGDGTVAGATQVHPQDLLALVLGFVVLVVLACLLLGNRWAQHTLSLLGVLAVVVLALGGHWEAALVFLAFVVGAVALLSEKAQGYLR